jgi:putative hydrolase of the HAD superfamily
MMDFRHKKVILFDLDNTLCATDENSRLAMREAYDELHFERILPPFDEFFSIYFRCNGQLWTQYREGQINREDINQRRFAWPLSLMGVTDVSVVAKLDEVFYKYFLPKHQVMPFAHEMLDYLCPKYRMAILSNGTKSSQAYKMTNCHFESYFEQVILSDDVGCRKPDAAIFDAALRQMNVSRTDALMIGDDFGADMVGAHNANLDSIWYNCRNEQVPADAGFEPNGVVTSLIQLKNML